MFSKDIAVNADEVHEQGVESGGGGVNARNRTGPPSSSSGPAKRAGASSSSGPAKKGGKGGADHRSGKGGKGGADHRPNTVRGMAPSGS